MPSAAMRLTGRVRSGAGEGARFLELPWVRTWLKASLALVPQPGTLNVELDQPVPKAWLRLRASDDRLLLQPPAGNYCASRWFPIRIVAGDRSRRGVVVVPEVSGYPPRQLEIVSAHHLRSCLDLTDDALVTVEVNSQ